MPKASNTVFAEFKEYILPLFASKFPPKGTSFIHLNAFDEFGDKMLAEYDYTPEREQFLVSNTLFYIRNFLPGDQSYSTDTDFLKKLLNRISIMFSNYVLTQYPAPESQHAQNKLRAQVQTELMTVLFDQNPYIIYLNGKHALGRRSRKTAASKMRKTMAQDAFQKARQVRGIFAVMQNTPRKHR